MKIRHITAHSILSSSKIPSVDYTLNPYVGCIHACRYCYAEFMIKYIKHSEPWGNFIDVKTNAPILLKKELKKKKRGNITISTVTDPYQPPELKYKITRGCLEALSETDWSVSILTKSDLVLRDLNILKRIEDVEVGLTITTDNEKIRQIFEPNTPSIKRRIETLNKLKENGISTYVFIGPILPMDPKNLRQQIEGLYDDIIIDEMNYRWKSIKLFRDYNIEKYLSTSFAKEVKATFRN